MNKQTVPFNQVSVAGNEVDYVTAAMVGGSSASGGSYSAAAQEILRIETGAKDVLLTTSCTSALEMSAMLLNLGPDDTVIVPSFTFVTSALAFARQGAKLLFCDIDPETLAPDPQHVAELLDDSVKAMVTLHYGGVPGDVAGLQQVLADRPDLTLVEDAAHGLFGRYHDQPLGSIGRFATLSFHETKNIVCGEGGALLLNNENDIDRAWVLYEKGTNRRAFFQGMVDKYSWRDTGSSFGLSNVLAAMLLGQLEQRSKIQQARERVYRTYRELLAPHAEDLGLRLPVVPANCVPAYHLFHVLLPQAATRPTVMQALKAKGINTTFHYVPLHDSPGGQRFARRAVDCPVTSELSARLLRLPFHNHLTEGQQQHVVKSLVSALREVQ
jgi:dTDP-4-amino-4,6-dideoxygalactose transaminase